MNTDELDSVLFEAERRVLKIQTKLHCWAREEPHRRFGPPRKFRTSVMGLSYAANCSFRNSLRTSLGVR